MWFQHPDAFTLVQFHLECGTDHLLKWFERSDLYPSLMRFGEHLHLVFSGSDSFPIGKKRIKWPGINSPILFKCIIYTFFSYGNFFLLRIDRLLTFWYRDNSLDKMPYTRVPQIFPWRANLLQSLAPTLIKLTYPWFWRLWLACGTGPDLRMAALQQPSDV